MREAIMSRVVFFALAVASGWVAAAPVPQPPAALLVAGLSDPSAKVRDEAVAALRGRVDALPWLRRAARSADADTARRAAALLAPHEPKQPADGAGGARGVGQVVPAGPGESL
jgi:hypothetical protein